MCETKARIIPVILPLCAVAAQLSGCNPTYGVAGQPSPERESSEAEMQIMYTWLIGFRREQEREFAERSRYCEEVSCDGRVTLLPAPYQTDYRVSSSGKSYSVSVRHRPSGRVCQLEDGFDAYPERAGRVICR